MRAKLALALCSGLEPGSQADNFPWPKAKHLDGSIQLFLASARNEQLGSASVQIKGSTLLPTSGPCLTVSGRAGRVSLHLKATAHWRRTRMRFLPSHFTLATTGHTFKLDHKSISTPMCQKQVFLQTGRVTTFVLGLSDYIQHAILLLP